MIYQQISKNHLQEIAKLRQKKHRLETRKVVVEGVRTLEQIREYGIRPLEQYIAIDKDAIWSDVPAYSLQDGDFGRLCDSETPSGIAALFDLPAERGTEFNLAFYLDGIADPGNLGTIFRIAAAFDLGQLLLSPDCVEVSSPKVIRASMGSVFLIPYQTMEYQQLLDIDARIICTDMNQGMSLTKFPERSSDNQVIVIGSEARGITEAIKTASQEFLHIPISPRMESLNAAIVAGILAQHFYQSQDHIIS
jgi:RNA methyltransferase, TrmH family